MQRGGIAVLRVLDQKHHQEGDNCCARVDDQLLGVRKLETRAGDCPCHDHEARQGKGGCAPALPGGPLGGRIE
jgi:hypothetical protein